MDILHDVLDHPVQSSWIQGECSFREAHEKMSRGTVST